MDNVNWDWLVHTVVVDFVATLALIAFVYCVACILFRLTCVEYVTPDEYTQVLGAALLSAAIFVSEVNEQEPSTYDNELDYVKAIVCLIVMRWTYITQIRGPTCSFKDSIDLNGKVVLLTGGTSGLGLKAAAELLKQYESIKIILPCRDMAKGELVRSNLGSRALKCVHLEVLDLESLDSVRTFVERTERSFPIIDVLINNAGVMTPRRTMTRDGHEGMLQTNFLAPLMLTTLLLPRLIKSSIGRVIMVSSSTCRAFEHVRFDDMEGEKSYNMFVNYAHSKFCLNLLTWELACRLKHHSKVSVFECHPGAIQSDVTRHLPLFCRLGHRFVIRMLIKSPLEGCQTVLYLATDQKTISHSLTGRFFEHLGCASVPVSDDEERTKLLEWCEKQTGVSLEQALKSL